MKKKENNKKMALLKISFFYKAAYNIIFLTKNINDKTKKKKFLQIGLFYIKKLNKISQKMLIRLPVLMKRTFCKKCNILLLPSITSTLFFSDTFNIKCLYCQNERQYKINENLLKSKNNS